MADEDDIRRGVRRIRPQNEIGLADPEAEIGAPSLSGVFTGKVAPQYEIWSKRQGKIVGTATSLKSARRVVDRRDNTYGAYDHYHKKIGRD